MPTRSKDSFDLIVGVAASRLYSPSFRLGARRYLSGLVTELEDHGALDNGLLRGEIARADRILVFDPVFRSGFCRDDSVCSSERVWIVDGSCIAFVALRSPLASIAYLYQALRAREVRRLLFSSGSVAKDLFAALMIDNAYCRILPRGRRNKALLLTSNSFATEVLRTHLLCRQECDDVCEVQHGIPSAWEGAYFARLLESPLPGRSRDKHRFVPQVRDLPLEGVFARRMPRDARGLHIGANTYFNKYLIGRQCEAAALTLSVERQWRTLFSDIPTTTDLLVVAFLGTTKWSGDARCAAMDSGVFRVEQSVMRSIRAALLEAGRPFVMIYSPHPLLPEAEVRRHGFFSTQGIAVYASSVFTWLVSDACVSLFSSSLFEANYFGVKSFSPIIPADGIYTPEVFALLAHPRGPRFLQTDLREFMLSLPRRGAIDILQRAETRLRKIAPWVMRPVGRRASAR